MTYGEEVVNEKRISMQWGLRNYPCVRTQAVVKDTDGRQWCTTLRAMIKHSKQTRDLLYHAVQRSSLVGQVCRDRVGGHRKIDGIDGD